MKIDRLTRCKCALALAVALSVAAAIAITTSASAQHAITHAGIETDATSHGGEPMSGHAHMHPPPAGVMGAHVMAKGQTMLMYTPMFMKMDGSRIGTRRASPEEIVTRVPNRFDTMPGMPGVQPATLRIAPDEMSAEMHMLSAMYGVTDSISIMVMSSYIEKRMTMITFLGPAGTTRLGVTEGSTEGVGDTSVGLAVKLWANHGHRLNGGLAVSIPTGSIDETGRMLSPMGMMMDMRSAYGMQLGTGTYDLLPSLTYMGSTGRLGWGAQMKGRIALQDENDEGYRWGNLYEATAWLSYKVTDGLSGTARLAASAQDSIDGRDPNIGGPFQGTYPEFYGGERVEAFLGLNGHIPLAHGTMARVGVEAGVPLYQNLNGPQLERDWTLAFTAGLHF